MDCETIIVVNEPSHDQPEGSSCSSDSMLSDTENEKVYLDYNATTPIDPYVVGAMSRSLGENWHNPSSQSRQGKLAKTLINEARSSLATMVNAENQSDLIFVSGGTEANNIVFYSMLEYYKELREEALAVNAPVAKVPHIIVSKIEHDSVKLIADSYRAQQLAEITEIEVNQNGVVSVKDVIDSIRPNTILISIMLANNETGVLQPVGEISRQLKELGLTKWDESSAQYSSGSRHCPLFVHTDAAQAIGKIRVDVEELQVDYLTIVGHKFYGPRIGALYARNCLNYQDLSSYSKDSRKAPVYHMFKGAGQERGLRPGTENTACIVGLGKAAELVNKNLEKYSMHMKEMRDYLETSLVREFGVDILRFNGKSTRAERLPNTCNVSFVESDDFKGYAILGNCKLLEASTGACCHSGELRPSKILLAMKIDKNIAANAVRLSVGRETTKEHIDQAIYDIKQSLASLNQL